MIYNASMDPLALQFWNSRSNDLIYLSFQTPMTYIGKFSMYFLRFSTQNLHTSGSMNLGGSTFTYAS